MKKKTSVRLAEKTAKVLSLCNEKYFILKFSIIVIQMANIHSSSFHPFVRSTVDLITTIQSSYLLKRVSNIILP